MLYLLCQCSVNGTIKPRGQHIYLQHGLPNILSSLLRPTAQKKKIPFKILLLGASLVAQWLRICLPMQGTWVRAPVWEDPSCRGAAGPVSHNC